jgi:uncharacterized membrane protein
MTEYPEVVAKIANDYLQRVKLQLRLVPAPEQAEFLREIQSHVYEAYVQTPGDDDVARILAVLGKLGEPAEVVADRLPGAMVRSGTKRNLPVYIVGGILIALFGIPLGFGGFGVLLGLLAALAGVMVAYYAVAGSMFLVSAVFLLTGATRILFPELWERLVSLGFIQTGEFFDRLPASDQGLIMILFACVFGACGWGLVRLGKHLLRGLRFLFSLVFDWMRRSAQSIRRTLRKDHSEGLPAGKLSFVSGK